MGRVSYCLLGGTHTNSYLYTIFNQHKPCITNTQCIPDIQQQQKTGQYIQYIQDKLKHRRTLKEGHLNQGYAALIVYSISQLLAGTH